MKRQLKRVKKKLKGGHNLLNTSSIKCSFRKLTLDRLSQMSQGNKRKPSYGDWASGDSESAGIQEEAQEGSLEGSSAWTSQEFSFDTEFSDNNDQQLPIDNDPDGTEYFK